MRIIRREKRVVHVQFAHGDAIGPRRPLAIKSLFARHTKQRRAVCPRMRERLRARVGDRLAIDGGDGNGGVVNDAVDDHLRDFGKNWRIVRRDAGEFPRQLSRLRQRNIRRVDFDVISDRHSMISH